LKGWGGSQEGFVFFFMSIGPGVFNSSSQQSWNC
jgi:hypothetical protein